MLRSKFYWEVLKAIIGILVVLLLCRLTQGAMSIVMVIVGVVGAIMRKPTVMVCCLVMFPLMAIFNTALIGLKGITLLVGKFSFVAMVVSSLLSSHGMSFKPEKLPIKWLFLYVGVACLSSISGWFPFISYLKLMNFSLMLIGLCLISRMMQVSFSSLHALRILFMAMSVILIVGSFVSYFVPSVGFSMMLYKYEDYGIIMTGTELVESGGQVLFNGMTSHSQMLSPVVACLGTWVLCDMLLVERRMEPLHCLILLCVPGLLYMSRSRGGLLMLACTMLITCVLTIPRARLPQKVKRHLVFSMIIIALALAGAGVYFQMKNEAVSRWLRKTDDVARDVRSLREAFTGSRQDSIAMNLRDFSLNPLFGKGFQVIQGMRWAYKARIITWFSAPIEKGVTPYVILGETGLLGGLAFLVFLCSFYLTCFRRGYMSLMTNFSCMLVANLADSTFFSPSALGGFMWTVSCIGAFSTDCLVKRLQRDSRRCDAGDMALGVESCGGHKGQGPIPPNWRMETWKKPH